MTTHRTSIGSLSFVLLCITTLATAQQRGTTESGAKQISKASDSRSPTMQRMTGTDGKQKASQAQNTAFDVTEVSVSQDIDRTAEVPRNGHFVSSGSAALIPVGQFGWHDISGWRDIRRAQSAR